MGNVANPTHKYLKCGLKFSRPWERGTVFDLKETWHLLKEAATFFETQDMDSYRDAGQQQQDMNANISWWE